MYSIVITSRAERELKRFDRPTKNRIVTAALSLADDPRPHGGLKVKAAEKLWRIRVGDVARAHLARDSRAGRPCHSVKLHHYRLTTDYFLYHNIALVAMLECEQICK